MQTRIALWRPLGESRKIMPRFLSIALALLATSGCAQAPAGNAVEYRPEDAGTVDHALCLLGFAGIPLSEVTTGHLLVDATLNGQPALFVVDTGANVSVLHASFARSFGITADPGAMGGAVGIGGSGEARQAGIDQLRIGPVDIRQRSLVLADLSPIANLLGPISGGTIHGVIGQDVLNEHRAVIDVSRPILYLIEADEDPAPVPAERCGPAEESAGADNAADGDRGGGATR